MFGRIRKTEKTEKKKKRRRIKEKLPRMQSEKKARVIAIMNRWSLPLHAVLACGVCFLIEWISRHSFLEACEFAVDRNLVFLYNSLIVFATLMLVYIVKRRMAARIFICAFWLFLGVINGCILAKRVSPFSFTDLKMVGDLFTMQSSYFSDTEAAIVIAGVAVVCVGLIVLWFKGPKYSGKTHRLAGVFMVAAMALLLPGVTNAAVSSNILTSYFENLAQGYKDYGFVYSFSSSVLDRGMSTPSGYSEEAVEEILSRMNGDDDTQTVAEGGDETDSSALSDTVTEAEDTVQSSAEQASFQSAELNPEYVGKQAEAPVSEESENSALPVKTVSVKTGSSSEEAAETEAGASEEEGETESEESEALDSESSDEEEDASDWEYPNIILVLLESFVDPALINFLETSEDPIPNFHYLYENYTSGYLEVPVVGAGTANTEFEVLTGMGMQFFGLGEYPYKTILKETNCESIASDLKTLGYGTHVVHNNGGNFYSRANAFSMMGFDTFTSKELLNILYYTPLGTWPIDDILISGVENALDYTPDTWDFVYTITVEGHGDYPQYEVLEDPDILVTGVEDEGMAYAWEYYVNMMHEVDDFIGDLISMLEARDEPTLVIMFGDHLPTMDLTEEDMTTGSLFLTQYVTWNNFGLEKEDKDMTSYQLLADMLEDIGIEGVGTMFTFHQNRDVYDSEEEYIDSMEILQYDILYGDHYVYGGENPYPASDLVMGTEEVVIDRIVETEKYYYVYGENFTKWSKVYIDGEKVGTTYISGTMLRFKKSKVSVGKHYIVVNQVGSSSTVFRSSNEILYVRVE